MCWRDVGPEVGKVRLYREFEVTVTTQPILKPTKLALIQALREFEPALRDWPDFEVPPGDSTLLSQ